MALENTHPLRIQTILKYRAQGWTILEIAKQLQIGWSSVRYVTKQFEVPGESYSRSAKRAWQIDPSNRHIKTPAFEDLVVKTGHDLVTPKYGNQFGKKVKLEPNTCWKYDAPSQKNKAHYGKWRNEYAHRRALERHLERPLGESMLALHICNNHLCVNPDHLYEGTTTDNIQDSVLQLKRKKRAKKKSQGPSTPGT